MAWVDDIYQAIKNLGGQASLSQIYSEVARIRIEPLSKSWQASIRERIEAHSSDSKNFKGKDLFKKVETGVWAIRKNAQNSEMNEENDKQSIKITKGREEMSNQELIEDTGLFIGQKVFEFNLQETFENINNLFQTIKQYRDFANPDEAAWFDYIHDFFNTLGFNIVRIAPRLIELHDLGTNKEPKALVCVVGPKESFSEIAYGIDWESYLKFASHFYKTDWVILTNGLQFKVINFGDGTDGQKYFKCQLDEIIKNGKTDSFFTLYKVFSVITQNNEKNRALQTTNKKTDGEKGTRKLVKRHYLRKEFWIQLLSRAQNKSQLHAKKTPSNDHWLSAGAGKSGISYNYIILKDGARVELYIDNGNYDFNKNAFDSLIRNKSEIENGFGDSLNWERLDDKRASLIRYPLSGIGLQDEDRWPELQDHLIELMINFEKAFKPYIQKIDK
jgi:hypothetical protein